MLKYFVRRLLSIIPVLLVVSILVFLFVHLLPGDPARIVAGQDADEATINRVRSELGLDKSLPEQYVTYMGRLFRGDLGRSLGSKLPVAEEIALRFPPTLYLALASLAWSIVIGILFGAYAAMHRESGKTTPPWS